MNGEIMSQINQTIYPVAILAGGLATRLRPLTYTLPKALIPVNGKPFIHHQLTLLQYSHIREVVLCLGYLGQEIEKYVGDGSRWNMRVQYSYDGPNLLGTAGSLKRALPLLGEHFFVLYGDSYLPCDYASIQYKFEHEKKIALMTVFRNQSQWDRSNVEYVQGKIKVYDKKNHNQNMQYIDYGLGIFSKSVLDTVPINIFYDLADLYHVLLKASQLAAYEVNQRFYEVGSVAGIQELEYYLSRHLSDSPELMCIRS
jgi:MurNAc alpha-1-phosphate uridylyltransferase